MDKDKLQAPAVQLQLSFEADIQEEEQEPKKEEEKPYVFFIPYDCR